MSTSTLRRRRQPDAETAHSDPPASTEKSKSRTSHANSAVFDSSDRAIAFALTVLALFTRLHQIGRRALVTWDEAHFGKFGAYYVNGSFYHDVHPPLAKMLIGLSEFLSGHNGSFTYTSGSKYPSYVNYTFQRTFVAVIGSLIVPFAYRTCRFLGFGRAAAAMAASFVLFDNALCLMSRFIILDPILYCFTAMSLLGYAGFTAYKNQPFSTSWWRWLAFTGVSLGLTISSKWVGAFVVLLVGLCTVEDLMMVYSDRSKTLRVNLKHWGARIACLIFFPLVVYLISFQIHFALLRKRGTGDYKMPSQFQALQRNSVVSYQPHNVALWSQVTLRSHLPGFGLIYANETNQFPDNSNELVAAGIPGKQSNNWWVVASPVSNNASDLSPVRFIADGDIVRFQHIGTKRFLRTGVAKPHSQGWDRRVFASGNTTAPSPWDFWRVRIIDDASPRSENRLYTVTTRFQLINKLSGCILKATVTQLPKWGRGMSELICADSNATRSEGTIWNIEQVRDKRFKPVSFKKLIGRRLVRDTIWINREMARSNNRLIPDPDRYKVIESDAWSWPFLIHPMRVGSWTDDSIKHYEIGNPILWWASALCCCVIYPLQIVYLLLLKQRKSTRWSADEIRQFWDVTKLLWGGWFLHYLPFFLFGRVLYIHHYTTALYFGLLLLAYEIQCAARWYLPPRAVVVAFLAVVVVAGYVFVLFSPLTYGWDKPIAQLAHLQWLPSWNLIKDPLLAL
ncbi:Protein O-mannosyltransferase 2 [Coemansia sp. RSA 990]|nr:Dolichyl-phosphate-mannose-protein mannosyltransferase-domain-containing protein [Coemansia mojavensis]KAJ1752849.1 Protein O-mannosyltransferase 2 [Coemansia sp. RSA 1821]KAJ1875804.1 Protein O-mannosyltransferase 2 [Coemansia sp. RSA 990]